jgi:hypothetical protein
MGRAGVKTASRERARRKAEGKGQKAKVVKGETKLVGRPAGRRDWCAYNADFPFLIFAFCFLPFAFCLLPSALRR